jgi:multiple sugar transport system ATP-binding protein
MNLVEDGTSWMGFRPESFLPRELESEADTISMSLRITRVEYLGADRLVYGILEGRLPETHVISKIPSNIRAKVVAGEAHDFVLRRSDIARFDRLTGQRMNGDAW